MQHSAEEYKRRSLAAVIDRIRQKWPDHTVPLLEVLVAQYFRRVPADDLRQRKSENLYGMTAAHWTLGRQRRPGLVRTQVINPTPDRHGWESSHTILQIVVDDQPFLVDSIAMALNRRGLTIHLTIHPILRVRRDDDDEIQELFADDSNDQAQSEAWMHFEVDRIADEEGRRALQNDVKAVIDQCRVVVNDWLPMRQRMQTVLDGLGEPRDREGEEIHAFLQWLIAEHFTYLGYRHYRLQKQGREYRLSGDPESALGLLRGGDEDGTRRLSKLPKDIRAKALEPDRLVLTKSAHRSPVHRPGYMDHVGIKELDDKGRVIGEHRFLGLYTSSAYSRNPREIPLLRRKLDAVRRMAGLPANSHSGKALNNLLETYPRDELFQSDTETLYRISMGILHLQERQRVRLFVREDTYRRFVSCLVYAPRDRYDSSVRRRMQQELEQAFASTRSEFSVNLSEAVLARIHFLLHVSDHRIPEVDLEALEQRLAHAARDWCDELHDALLDYYGEADGNHLFDLYGQAFSAAYREDTSARTGAQDVARLESLDPEHDLQIMLYRPLEAPEELIRLRLYRFGEAIPLSDVLPLLENLGLRVVDERPYTIHLRTRTHWIHDFGLLDSGANAPDLDQIRELFESGFDAIWHGRVENDGFNRLLLAARLGWAEIMILRAYGRYLRQAGTTFSQAYIEDTLVGNPRIARLLVRLFHYRLDPDRFDDKRAARVAEQVELALAEVPSLDEDRILRRLLAAIQATLRTSFYQEASDDEALSLKLTPAAIPDMPEPHPAFEIYVYSPRVEGVHLRGGKVARGGLRWSERKEDFRTEVLGLMKAQMVKNAVIVPLGAKGGFVARQLPEEREAQLDEVRTCYRLFIRALLNITDNYPGGKVTPPPRVVRQDDDDPYLVVAADKGTATFSDTANAIAADYGFWLGDAFASGGSNGYDHKKMGITARGAWVAVRRHFREMDHDIQTTPFSVIGVGDMSGDVFGNGMLLSRQIRLVAAFDHRHIFLDPDPDPERSFRERQRLFDLARSSWDDYDREQLSEGGGVFPRTAKSVEPSARACKALGIAPGPLTPAELIQAILRAPVDLFWNGGIGTYVKASSETHPDVGDRSNDAVRVNADELRCRVIGEGGNLGVTQRARIEFARAGGRINTDAIDNVGGVDCSDHEVNIKILLNGLVENGELTEPQRNRLLAEMSDEVAELVLLDNDRQTESLSIMQARAPQLLAEHSRLIRDMEASGRLNRELEALPGERQIAEWLAVGHGLTRPETAVLLAHAKLAGYEALIETDLPEDPDLQDTLYSYFPSALREQYGEYLPAHRLRREIVATQIANELFNRLGASVLLRLNEKAGATGEAAARAYFIARRVFGLDALWAAIDQLNHQVSGQTQTELRLAVLDVVEAVVLWLVRHFNGEQAIAEAVARLQRPVAELETRLAELLPADDQAYLGECATEWRDAGVPDALAQRIVQLEPLSSALDITLMAEDTAAPLTLAAELYFRLAAELELRWLAANIQQLPGDDPWQERFRSGLQDGLGEARRQLATALLQQQDRAENGAALLETWRAEQARALFRLQHTLQDLRAAGTPTAAMLSVTVQDLQDLANRTAQAHVDA
ncbi:NAD-glutamate dehydrogenase [Methylonatrum kenyense]|uniref:NAD-glutamate dehydrogenase n=1 Tax=Methylonatrum kenyense TaxID=455253 RepID=UPI0020BF4654|nr:NAD-glutamate dehydrogenase [Methylonatrum kenyense]MCK8515303.1 NAD-glutamate dehydrogenase [Methylonatrum kenyense]